MKEHQKDPEDLKIKKNSVFSVSKGMVNFTNAQHFRSTKMSEK